MRFSAACSYRRVPTELKGAHRPPGRPLRRKRQGRLRLRGYFFTLAKMLRPRVPLDGTGVGLLDHDDVACDRHGRFQSCRLANAQGYDGAFRVWRPIHVDRVRTLGSARRGRPAFPRRFLGGRRARGARPGVRRCGGGWWRLLAQLDLRGDFQRWKRGRGTWHARRSSEPPGEKQVARRRDGQCRSPSCRRPAPGHGSSLAEQSRRPRWRSCDRCGGHHGDEAICGGAAGPPAGRPVPPRPAARPPTTAARAGSLRLHQAGT